jgi:hypothetical protein
MNRARALWREGWRYRRGIAAIALAIGVVAAVAHVRSSPYALTIAWSALLVASFVGWGSLVNFWLVRGQAGGRVLDPLADWGLRAGWGMALFLLLGGYLSLLHAAIRPVLIAQVALGDVALLAAFVVRRPRRLSRRRFVVWTSEVGVLALVFGACAFAALFFFGYLGDQTSNPSDDPPLYFMLPQRLVETGSLFEPFCARRITTFGGQVYLHAAFLSVAPMSYITVVDLGIAPVIVVGLLVGTVVGGSGRGLKGRHLVPLGLVLLLFFSLQSVRGNIGSLMTSVAAVLTLYRSVRAPIARGPEPPLWPTQPRRVVMLAALVVTCILLRTSVAAAILPFVVLVFASDLVRGTRGFGLRRALGSVGSVAAIFAGSFVVALLPWSLLMHESVGSYFFPFGQNNITPGWGFLAAPKTLEEACKHLLDLLFWDTPVTIYLPFAIAGLVPLAGRRRNDTAALTIGALIGVVTLARSAAAFNERDSSRYFYAYAVSMALVAAASARRADMRAALVAVGLGMHLTAGREPLHKLLVDLVHMAKKAYEERKTTSVDFASRTREYRDLQSHVPEGATIATAVHEGWQFDFKRNRIFSLDVLGGMGPKPGWPAYRGPAALGDYLTAKGVQYLIWVDFGIQSDFLNREHWRGFLAWDGSYLQGEARLQLDAEDSIEKLTAMRRVVYRAHGMTVVDLAPPH